MHIIAMFFFHNYILYMSYLQLCDFNCFMFTCVLVFLLLDVLVFCLSCDGLLIVNMNKSSCILLYICMVKIVLHLSICYIYLDVPESCWM